jgi:hypothetical protein
LSLINFETLLTIHVSWYGVSLTTVAWTLYSLLRRHHLTRGIEWWEPICRLKPIERPAEEAQEPGWESNLLFICQHNSIVLTIFSWPMLFWLYFDQVSPVSVYSHKISFWLHYSRMLTHQSILGMPVSQALLLCRCLDRTQFIDIIHLYNFR